MIHREAIVEYTRAVRSERDKLAWDVEALETDLVLLKEQNKRLLAENRNHAEYMDRENAKLRDALELCVKYGSFEQGGGILHTARAALEKK